MLQYYTYLFNQDASLKCTNKGSFCNYKNTIKRNQILLTELKNRPSGMFTC